MKFIQIITTCPDKKSAKKIVKELLEDNLVACCQIIGPVESNYWWRGKIEGGKEWLVFIKGKAENYKKIEKRIKKEHPYEVPEIISFEISRMSKNYEKYLLEI